MTRFVVWALVALAASPAGAQDAPETPFSLVRERPGDGPLSGLLRLRGAEATFAADGQWGDTYAQMMAQRLAMVGDHAGALRWRDRSRSAQPFDSVGTLPAGTQALDAVDLIARRAADTQVVMINEAHHDATSRILTLRLLPALYAQGYRYFAAEAFGPDVVAQTASGYPTPQSGTYVGEPVFGAVVREALRLGYTLVPYEIEDEDEEPADTTLTRQQVRDLAQARLLAERTVERDPEARVLVHAGYAHVYEAEDEYWSPMAFYFREITGIDPLTVDQTVLSERSAPAFEHPRWRAAEAAGLLYDSAIVLADTSSEPLAPVGDAAVDLQVLTPRTPYVDGRPAWPSRDLFAMDGQFLTDCTAPACLVETFFESEGGVGVPIDRVAVAPNPSFSILIPRGAGYMLHVLDGRTGERLKRPIHGDAPPPPPPPRP